MAAFTKCNGLHTVHLWPPLLEEAMIPSDYMLRNASRRLSGAA